MTLFSDEPGHTFDDFLEAERMTERLIHEEGRLIANKLRDEMTAEVEEAIKEKEHDA